MKITLDIPISINEITHLLKTDSKFFSNQRIASIVTDSREAEAGDLFVALSGTNDNGENHVKEAISKGAIVLSNQKIKGSITVSDTVYALQYIANYYKNKLKNLKYTIAITGSVGKTTTKNFLKVLADEKYRVHATEGNYNNHIGVPLTILSAKKDTEVLIIEMGMNHSGEISSLSKCAEPDIAVITNIGTAHIGNLGSRENIAKAKLEILDGMKRPTLIVPYDEKLLLGNFEKITFSTHNTNADIYIIYNEEKNILVYDNKYTEFVFKAHGMHNLECLSSSIAAALKLNIEISTIKSRISLISDKICRQNIERIDDFYILSDYYNASLESIKSALDLLSTMKDYSFKSALIGTVKETGYLSSDIHKEIGRIAARSGIFKLYLFGEFAMDMFEGAKEEGFNVEKILINPDENAPEITAKQITDNHIKNELILFKSSNATRLGRIVGLLKQREEK